MKLNLSILLTTFFLSFSALAQTTSETPATTPATIAPGTTAPAATTTTTTMPPSSTQQPANGTMTTNGTTNGSMNGATQQPSTMTTSTTSTVMHTTNPADENQRAGEEFLAKNKLQQGVVTLPSGLEYRVLSKGNGPKPAKDDVVVVNYEGKHLNGQVFDSSYHRGQPASFPVDAVIPGWQEALQLMNVGDTWELFIPGNLAYGARGVPGAIAPNETLIFKVNLIGIKPKALQQ